MMSGDRLSPTRRLALGALVLVAAAVGFAAGRFLLRPAGSAPQPIAFNHLLHVEEVGMECATCHEHFASGEHAGLPGIDLCLTCHEEPMTESPEERRLIELAGIDPSPAFIKLFRMPDHVYYSHRRHTVVAGLECSTCHGPIASTTAPPQAALVRITMQMCIDCHEKNDVTGDCSACHR